jgi:hypothetical protein
MLWLFAFVWTLAIELPIYTIVLARCFQARWAVVVLTLAVNLATHPALWFVLPRSWPHDIAIGEAAVVVVEAALVAIVLGQRVPLSQAVPRAVAAALLANAASYLAGLVLIPLVT